MTVTERSHLPEMSHAPDLPHVPDLDQLRALTSAARAGSMSTAAREVGVSQQAVSARIRAAERILGVAVFERSTQGVALTGAGQLVVTWANGVLDAAAALEAGVSALRAEGSHVVRVAASNTVFECLLPGWAILLRAQRPDVQLQVSPGNSDMVLDLVASGGADLGYVEGPSIPRTVRSRVVAKDVLVVVVPADHRWASASDGIDSAELARTPLVVREAGSGTRTRLESALPDRVPAAMVLTSTAAVRDAALALGVPTVLSSLAVRQDLESGRLVAIRVRDLSLPRLLRAVWHPSQRPQGATADLLRISSTLSR